MVLRGLTRYEANVRFGSKADMCSAQSRCPLCANSGHLRKYAKNREGGWGLQRLANARSKADIPQDQRGTLGTSELRSTRKPKVQLPPRRTELDDPVHSQDDGRFALSWGSPPPGEHVSYRFTKTPPYHFSGNSGRDAMSKSGALLADLPQWPRIPFRNLRTRLLPGLRQTPS